MNIIKLHKIFICYKFYNYYKDNINYKYIIIINYILYIFAVKWNN